MSSNLLERKGKMDKLEKLEEAVMALDKFTASEKTKWDYKMLCSSLETTLYYAQHESMYDAIDTMDTSKLDELNRRVYEFMINEVPLAYRGHIADPIIFHPGRIQRLFPKYDIKFNNELCMLCNINRHISIILLYMLAIYVNDGGDMIL
jgi:hypothetical protein